MVMCKSRWPEVGKLVVWCVSVSEVIALNQFSHVSQEYSFDTGVYGPSGTCSI